nr:zinc ribbon domain-containing protein [Variovorax boronicumulans]
MKTTDTSSLQQQHNGTVSLNNSSILITADVASPEQPRMSSLQCLFCQHLNPADVDYCNSCDGQLNLRPCYRCGAVDLRTATHCHKCGGDFSLASPPVGDFQFRPSNFDQASIDGETTPPLTPQSEAAALGAKLPYSRLDRQSIDGVGLPANSAPAVQSQQRTRLTVLALLFVLVIGALSAYWYRQHSLQGQAPAPSSLSDTRNPQPSTPSDLVDGPAAAATPAQAVPAPPARENQPAQRQAAAAARADAVLSLPLPDSGAGAETLQDPSTGKPCPAAVAALGLCNLDTPQEKR